MKAFFRSLLPVIAALPLPILSAKAAPPSGDAPRPLLRDFIGICTHTVQFKPELYRPVTRMLRDYHPVDWDLGGDTSFKTTFPMARNGVDWSKLYGSWAAAGYRTEASLMFDDISPSAWKDLPRDAFAYGKAFAAGNSRWLEGAEIGNEPGKYDDATYRTLFEAMARGIREGAPAMRIATCAANLGPSGRYSKSVDCLAGLEALYDAVNIHVYAEVEGWPTWRRSYPEDPTTHFLENIGHVLAWRAEHAPAKEVWLTEFGWDATSKTPPKEGDFAKWIGSTETEQAVWIVRAYLLLSATPLDRAYLYFFNDDDTPHLHGSSGLTRNFAPKPAFYALAHLQQTLGGFRFSHVIRQEADGYLYEFTNDAGERVWVAWKPAGPAAKLKVDFGKAKVSKAERTPLGAEQPKPEPVSAGEIEFGETPLYLWLSPG